MYKKYIVFLVFILLIYRFSASAQDNWQSSTNGTDSNLSGFNINLNVMLARSSTDYRVTPGDVYTLTYAAGATAVNYVITVDSSYRIRVSNLGVINGSGKTFLQLKTEVEATVTNNYPLSGAQLVITQPAIFKVVVNGEVNISGEVSTWGLDRLSSLAGGNLTGSASIRDISIRSANGQINVYDLFKAQRLGDLSQDPYLRPGDIITFNRVNRVVTINGAVERPGTYQLLEGENMKSLIENYSIGFIPLADMTRITLTRYVNSVEIYGDITYLTEEDINGDFDLQHFDIISVPWRGFVPNITLPFLAQ